MSSLITTPQPSQHMKAMLISSLFTGMLRANVDFEVQSSQAIDRCPLRSLRITIDVLGTRDYNVLDVDITPIAQNFKSMFWERTRYRIVSREGLVGFTSLYLSLNHTTCG